MPLACQVALDNRSISSLQSIIPNLLQAPLCILHRSLRMLSRLQPSAFIRRSASVTDLLAGSSAHSQEPAIFSSTVGFRHFPWLSKIIVCYGLQQSSALRIAHSHTDRRAQVYHPLRKAAEPPCTAAPAMVQCNTYNCPETHGNSRARHLAQPHHPMRTTASPSSRSFIAHRA